MDVKDILGLPKVSLPSSQEKKSRTHKDSQRKPDGVSREVYALTGGLPPVMPSLDPLQLKRRPSSEEKISWQWLPFTSSARTDNLQLYHWVRVVNGIPPTGDYSFAKYNKCVDILKYTDEEYTKYLSDPLWTKEETDQLFDMCERFDLRFIVIADRFPCSRSIEELKSRYYTVSRALLMARAPSLGDVAGHPLVKEQYNMTHEIERKRSLSVILSQTKQQERRNAEIIAEAKRIAESRINKKDVDEPELHLNIGVDSEVVEKSAAAIEPISPSSSVHPQVDIVIPSSTTTDNTSIPISLRMLRVYLRTSLLDQLVQATSSSPGLRTVKRVDQTLQDLGVNAKPRVPTKAVCREHLELRKEILTLLNLQKQLQYKDAESLALRDTEMPSTPKRARGDQDRPFVPESMAIGGDKSGKRDSKRKAPGRYSDAPPSPPQSKRPRKLKASD